MTKQKIVKKSDLDKITQKLYKGFIQANFSLLHFQKIRMKFRNALLEKMRFLYQENIKIIDTDLKVATNLSWCVGYGEFNQIMPLPYECLNMSPKMAYNRELLKNPLKIIKGEMNNG